MGKFRFRAYSAKLTIEGVSFHFIESTAPNTVEQRVDPNPPPWPGLTPVDPDQAVKDIAGQLLSPAPPGLVRDEPTIVVMVHGYNNPRERVLEFYDKALEALRKDEKAIGGARRIACIGYRWPSEAANSILSSSFRALPYFPLAIFGVSVVLLIAVFLRRFGADVGWFTSLPGILKLGLGLVGVVAFAAAWTVAVAALLRAVAYFRDVYRATNHGVPDLVEVLRQIDRAACDIANADGISRKRIALSFIGHSMGGFVVTNAIRVLTDVFDRDAIQTYLSGTLRPLRKGKEFEGDERVPGKIGHVFTLMRFVLVATDIPGETLIADRANFLGSSLKRFREAYLFCNEGDEVLRLISTTANYFSFPTVNRNFGYRLGNAEILTSDFQTAPKGQLLDIVRVGLYTLRKLSEQVNPADPAAVARAFTFFDCTDYVENGKGMLTEAKNYKRNNPKAGIPILEHLRLLWLNQKGLVSVHGGYFDGELAQRLMCRLACLGYADANAAFRTFQGKDLLSACAAQGIRVAPSIYLDMPGLPPEDMETADSEALERQIEDLQDRLQKSNADLERRIHAPPPGQVTVTETEVEIGPVAVPKRIEPAEPKPPRKARKPKAN